MNNKFLKKIEMKNTYINIAFSLLFILFAGSLWAQTPIQMMAHFPNRPFSDTAIVRNFNDRYSVVYSKSANNGNRFYLVEHATGIIAKSFKTDNDVKDMEIDKDTLYYCGLNSNRAAILGYFAIMDLLSSSLPDYNVQINIHPDFQAPLYIPRRMEVFHVPDGVHAIVLVDAKFNTGAVKHILTDVYSYYNSWRVFSGCYVPFGEGNNIFCCDDLAVTDNYVFLLGHKKYSAGIYMRKFKKPTCCVGANDNIFYSNIYNEIYNYAPTFGGNINILGDGLGEHSAYCTHTVGDSVAIACMASYYDGTTFTYGTSIKCFDVSSLIPTYPPYACTSTYEVFHPYTSVYDRTWEVKDLRYNPINKNILMLHDISNPFGGPLERVVTAVDYPALSTAVMTWPTSNYKGYSMDKFDGMGNGIVSIGAGGVGVLELCTNQYYTTDCFSVFFPNVMMWVGEIQNFTVEVDNNNRQSGSFPTTRYVENETAVVICP
ncbi:MAG: hypothetical protein IKN11_09990 [Bacteroidales bacterium]|nr:hypothetical protein [Bacteroidales bacterium]